MTISRRGLDVIVVGGGLGGLACATLLAREGRAVAVVESAETLGGRARTRVDSGLRFNLGPHALYLEGPGARVLASLGIRPTGGVPRGEGGLVLTGGAAHALPAGPLSLLTTSALDLAGKLEAGRLLAGLGRLETRGLEGMSTRAWIDASIRSPGLARLIEGLMRVATYAHASDRLSASVALRQMQMALGQGVRYVDGGWQTLVDALVERAAVAGVERVVRARAVAVDPKTREVRLHDGRVLAAGAVVLAVPPRHAEALCPAAGPPRALVPARAACLDLGLRRLPRRRAAFAVGLDAPTYLSVHSRYASLGDGVVIHVARYLEPESDGQGVLDDLEWTLDLAQPGWREEVIARRYYPSLTVTHAIPLAAEGGFAGRPGVLVSEGVYRVGDWVGERGHLADLRRR